MIRVIIAEIQKQGAKGSDEYSVWYLKHYVLCVFWADGAH